jgi:hypothetical protein
MSIALTKWERVRRWLEYPLRLPPKKKQQLFTVTHVVGGSVGIATIKR